jgi:hypothetical protein
MAQAILPVKYSQVWLDEGAEPNQLKRKKLIHDPFNFGLFAFKPLVTWRDLKAKNG